MKSIWVCPALCGCEIEMEADFDISALENDSGRTVSYRHPKPYTISSMTILNTCVAHQPLLSTPIDESQFMDYDIDFGGFVQNRGYLKLPIVSPTSAEMLYSGLYKYTAQIWSPSVCKCHLFGVFERDKPGQTHVIKKSILTKRCIHHKNDTDDAQAVRDEVESVTKGIQLLMNTFQKLDGGQDGIKYRFEADRSIVFSHPLLNQTDKDSINALPKPDIKKSIRVE